jgi:chromosome segregation ATPase
MFDPAAGVGSSTQILDWLFSRIGGSGGEPPIEGKPERANDDPASLAAPPPAPPALTGPADLQAAHEWLLRERKRLEAYTEAQLRRLHGEHQAMLQQNYLNDQGLVLRCQEVSRKEELLASQSRALQRQAEEVARREQALAEQLTQWWKAHEELANVQQLHANVAQEATAQQAMLGSLQSEIAALQQSREAARADLEAMAVAIESQRDARAKHQALLTAQQAQLAGRLESADRAEAAASRRLAELEELEVRLYREISEQERQLAAERRELRALEDRLRRGAALGRPAEVIGR